MPLSPIFIYLQVLLDHLQADSDNRRVVYITDNGYEVRDDIYGAENVEECGYDGGDGPERHLAVVAVVVILDEAEQEFEVGEEFCEGAVAAEYILDFLFLIQHLCNVVQGDFFGAAAQLFFGLFGGHGRHGVFPFSLIIDYYLTEPQRRGDFFLPQRTQEAQRRKTLRRCAFAPLR